MRRILLIVNPVSGKKTAQNKLFSIVEPFCKNGDSVTVMITSKQGDATRFACGCKGYDMVACIGGDGTFNEVVNGVLQSKCDIPIGYIPAGSTNDFATTLGLSKIISRAVKDVVEGEEKTIDMGKFGTRYFSYVASFGAFTRTSYATKQSLKNTLGHLAYLLEGANEIMDLKSYDVRLVADGEEYKGEYLFGAVTNTLSMGGVLSLKKKNVLLDDGLFEVLLIRKPKNIIELQATITAILDQSFKAPTIDFLTAREIKADGGERFTWSIDGERAVSDGEVKIKNLQKAVKIIVKKSSV